MESIAIRKCFPQFRSVCGMAVWWWVTILCYNSTGERIVVGFRSIIIVARQRPERRRHHHHHHDRYPRQRRNNNNVALSVLPVIPSNMVPNDIAEENTEAMFIPSDSNEIDDANNVASLRSVTFSHLPKDQEPNLLCELLMEYGACASWITDADRYTEFEEPIFHEPPVSSSSSHTIEQMLATPWIAPVWNQCNVTALFPASIHIPTTVAAIREIYSDIVAIVVDDDLGVSDEDVAASDDQNADTSNNVANIKSSSPPRPSGLIESYDVETIPNNKDWVLSVQQSWHPIVINDCFILRFPWHTDDDVATAIQMHYNGSRSDNYNIVSNVQEDEQSMMTKGEALIPILLQGGIAFGTGEHATTQLCLQWLHDTVSQTLLSQPNRLQRLSIIRVLDYGTGSGILGIAACAMGQQEQHRRSIPTADFDAKPLVTAVGIDIDIDACRIANANAILNGNVAMKSYLPSLHNNAHDDESQSLLMKAHYNYQQQQHQPPPPPNAITDQNTAATLDDIVLSDPSTVLCAESFDICVANILAGPLIVLAHTLYNYLQPGGMIGMSGILTHQGNMIVETYQNVGFINVRVHDTMNGWILVTGQRPFL